LAYAKKVRGLPDCFFVLFLMFMLDLAFRNLTTDKKYDSNFFENVLNVAAKETELPSTKNFELSVRLVGEGKIKSLNKRYRNKNKVTDVLSFPLFEKIGVKELKSGIIGLGDIFICLPYAKKQAKRDGKKLDDELSLLVVHGFLHLLGYDHENDRKREQKMFAFQNKILKALHV
jgi:probable rRNA maturation factor